MPDAPFQECEFFQISQQYLQGAPSPQHSREQKNHSSPRSLSLSIKTLLFPSPLFLLSGLLPENRSRMPFGSRIAKINIELYIKFQGGKAGSQDKAPHLLSDKVAKRYGFQSFSFVHTHSHISSLDDFQISTIFKLLTQLSRNQNRNNPRQNLGCMPRTTWNPRLSPKQDFRRESVITKLCQKGGSHWLSAARGAREVRFLSAQRYARYNAKVHFFNACLLSSIAHPPPPPGPKSAGNISRCFTASLSTHVKSIQCQILSSECEIDSSQCEIYCVNVNIYIHIYIYICIDPSASLENKVQHLCVNSILYIHEDKSSILVLVKTKDLVGL